MRRTNKKGTFNTKRSQFKKKSKLRIKNKNYNRKLSKKLGGGKKEAKKVDLSKKTDARGYFSKRKKAILPGQTLELKGEKEILDNNLFMSNRLVEFFEKFTKKLPNKINSTSIVQILMQQLYNFANINETLNFDPTNEETIFHNLLKIAFIYRSRKPRADKIFKLMENPFYRVADLNDLDLSKAKEYDRKNNNYTLYDAICLIKEKDPVKFNEKYSYNVVPYKCWTGNTFDNVFTNWLMDKQSILQIKKDRFSKFFAKFLYLFAKTLRSTEVTPENLENGFDALWDNENDSSSNRVDIGFFMELSGVFKGKENTILQEQDLSAFGDKLHTQYSTIINKVLNKIDAKFYQGKKDQLFQIFNTNDAQGRADLVKISKKVFNNSNQIQTLKKSASTALGRGNREENFNKVLIKILTDLVRKSGNNLNKSIQELIAAKKGNAVGPTDNPDILGGGTGDTDPTLQRRASVGEPGDSTTQFLEVTLNKIYKTDPQDTKKEEPGIYIQLLRNCHKWEIKPSDERNEDFWNRNEIKAENLIEVNIMLSYLIRGNLFYYTVLGTKFPTDQSGSKFEELISLFDFYYSTLRCSTRLFLKEIKQLCYVIPKLKPSTVKIEKVRGEILKQRDDSSIFLTENQIIDADCSKTYKTYPLDKQFLDKHFTPIDNDDTKTRKYLNDYLIKSITSVNSGDLQESDSSPDQSAVSADANNTNVASVPNENTGDNTVDGAEQEL